MQTSVHRAQKISLRRPVFRTAATKSASSHELMLVRSIGAFPSSTVARSGTVGLPRPDATLIVECTTGSPKAFAILTVDTTFFTRSWLSIDRIDPTCDGW